MLEQSIIHEIDIVELANTLHYITQCRSIIIEEPMHLKDANDTHTIVTLSKESLVQTKNIDGKDEFIINSIYCKPIKLPIKVTDKEGTHRDKGRIYYKFDFY